MKKKKTKKIFPTFFSFIFFGGAYYEGEFSSTITQHTAPRAAPKGGAQKRARGSRGGQSVVWRCTLYLARTSPHIVCLGWDKKKTNPSEGGGGDLQPHLPGFIFPALADEKGGPRTRAAGARAVAQSDLPPPPYPFTFHPSFVYDSLSAANTPLHAHAPTRNHINKQNNKKQCTPSFLPTKKKKNNLRGWG